ncbi:N-acetylmuramoyl-L-alanine amidase [Brachybacterium sp. UNK5269]|uniref:N-acetylmuramoyl-L-alanine amidase n=1 Tax=Brachybacterium sp. UNK5269 TaxID=3408576 RepID=UPI003BB15091
MSQRHRPHADLDRSRTPGLSRRALLTATAVGVPTAAALATAAPALADPSVTDGQTRIVEVPLAEAPLVEVDGARVRELAEQPATMIGVTWPEGTDAPAVSARGRAEDGSWTEWTELEVAEDPESGTSAAATEVAWLGVVSALQIRAELDGGDVSADLTAHVVTTSPLDSDDQVRQLTGPSATRTQSQQMSARAAVPAANPATPALGPGAPAFVTRAAWRADESLVRGTSAKNALKAVVLHHTAGTNNYSSSQSAQIVRGILTYHTTTLGWADLGYNVLVDKYGQIFEGRSGGLHRNITGAHSLGFNSGSFGISVMGNYSSTSLPSAARTAVARLVAWKLLSTFQTSVGGDVSWQVTTSGTRHTVGSTVSLPRMMGHRDVNFTECPGARIYSQFGNIRSEAQRYLDSGGKEHLWAFQGAGGAATLGTVVRSNHRTGKYSATILTKGLVLQESGAASGYATPFAPQWSSSWGRPAASAPKDGDRQIQPFQHGTAALESGKVRFVAPTFRDVPPWRVFLVEIEDLFAAGVTQGWEGGSNRTF